MTKLIKKARINIYSSGAVLDSNSGLEEYLLYNLENSPKHLTFLSEIEKISNVRFIDRNYEYDSEFYNCHTHDDEGFQYNVPFGELFRNEIYLKFEFGKLINLFDFITPNCFYSDSEIGNYFIAFLKDIDVTFLVYEKEWEDDDNIAFEMLMGNSDSKRKMREKFIGTYKFDG